MRLAVLSLVTAAALGGLFLSIGVEAAREKERARIESIQATPEYQMAYARQLARWRRCPGADAGREAKSLRE